MQPADTSLDGLRIAVAGGGIGGLAAALSCALRGARVEVFERRENPTEDGAGIQIGPNGTRILKALGVEGRLAANISVPDALIVREASSGKKLARLPLGHWMASRHGSEYWVAHRADLHAALREAAEASDAITVRLGVEIDGWERDGDRVSIAGRDGPVGNADLIVVSDGLHSKLRASIAGPSELRFLDRVAMRAVVPVDEKISGLGLELECVGIWLSAHGHIVHYPVRGGRELAIVVIRVTDRLVDGWGSPASANEVDQVARTFAGPVRDLTRCAGEWRKWALAGCPVPGTWVRDRGVLLGDAAHPVLPFLAQGAVLALEDADVLARSLAGEPDIDAALHSYQEARGPRARQVQDASKRNGQIYHLSGPMALARNQTLRWVPGERLMSGYDWLYGWRA